MWEGRALEERCCVGGSSVCQGVGMDGHSVEPDVCVGFKGFLMHWNFFQVVQCLPPINDPRGNKSRGGGGGG